MSLGPFLWMKNDICNTQNNCYWTHAIDIRSFDILRAYMQINYRLTIKFRGKQLPAAIKQKAQSSLRKRWLNQGQDIISNDSQTQSFWFNWLKMLIRWQQRSNSGKSPIINTPCVSTPTSNTSNLFEQSWVAEVIMSD